MVGIIPFKPSAKGMENGHLSETATSSGGVVYERINLGALSLGFSFTLTTYLTFKTKLTIVSFHQ